MNFASLVTVALAASMVCACGGGASAPSAAESLTRDGLVHVPLDSGRIIKNFSDGSVWRSRPSALIPTAGATGVVIGPATYPARTASITPLTIDQDSLIGVGANDYGVFYDGAISTGEGTESATIFIDNQEQLLVISYQNRATSNLSAFGATPENIPFAGSAAYEGTNIFTLRNGSVSETGTFVMTVNFSSQTGILHGQTASTNISVSDIAFDLANGQFYSNLATLSVDGNTYDASLYGSFHGDGGTGVTGIYHQNSETAPLMAGAVAGGIK